MEFDDFVQNISRLKNKPLGGLMAQFKLAPQFRLEYESKKDQVQHPKKAAVLALFYPNKVGETSFVLTQRATIREFILHRLVFLVVKLSDKIIHFTTLL